ncbi:MAG TPA: biotin synthase, partial [Polyangiales bacterium]
SEDGSKVVRARDFAPAGQSTQMIIGATATSDRTILDTASGLYRAHALRRVYYSAFSPFGHEDPRLPPQPPPLAREHRLYQADWLMRHYGFVADELTRAEQPNLDLDIDPKLAWALRHRALFPVDLNRAPRELLLRVPGLGVRTVDKLLSQRTLRPIRLADLARLRVPVRRVEPFVITADPPRASLRLLDAEGLERMLRPAQQLALFAGPAGHD